MKFHRQTTLTWEELCVLLDSMENECRLGISEIDSDDILVYKKNRGILLGITSVKSKLEHYLSTRQIEEDEEL